MIYIVESQHLDKFIPCFAISLDVLMGVSPLEDEGTRNRGDGEDDQE